MVLACTSNQQECTRLYCSWFRLSLSCRKTLRIADQQSHVKVIVPVIISCCWARLLIYAMHP
jgi:hypothetical protein